MSFKKLFLLYFVFILIFSLFISSTFSSQQLQRKHRIGGTRKLFSVEELEDEDNETPELLKSKNPKRKTKTQFQETLIPDLERMSTKSKTYIIKSKRKTIAGFAVGLHYYVTVFHRAVLNQSPKINWKINGVYAVCFLVICVFAGAEIRKKAYLEDGGDEGKKR
ncbi:hypothetical protein MKX03_032710 [Papaver bracteatum]|nr:hypothetical protein MKX03_032710 [Papaver bracteatum]